ncbi:MAG TPA: hypothetical protein VE616_03370, partial [Candidatus Udaeobacter sp.]|nr:hypothetical protein [Candidatus Udaeobacter sp.]
AAIMDAASLREKSGLNAQELQTVHGWKLPMIWIDDEASGEDSARNKVVILKQPISRKALMAALAECLGETAKGKSTGPTARTEPDKFIELTEVVEEGPESDKTKA